MIYTVDTLSPSVETALNALTKIAPLSISRVITIETDNPEAMTVIEALIGESAVRRLNSPAAPFLESEPEKVERAPADHTTIANSCANCGMVFDARRKDQRYCSKPECQKAKNKQYQAAWLSKKHGGNGDQPETQAAEATPDPLAQS